MRTVALIHGDVIRSITGDGDQEARRAPEHFSMLENLLVENRVMKVAEFHRVLEIVASRTIG